MDLLEPFLLLNHREYVLDVVVDLVLLDDLLQNDLVLFLQLLMRLPLSLQLVFRDVLCPVQLCLFGGDLQIHPVELLDLLFLFDALLAQLDASLLRHTHIIDDVLAAATLLGQLCVVFLDQSRLLGVLLLQQLHVLCLGSNEVCKFGHLFLLLLNDLFINCDAFSGVLLGQFKILLVLSAQAFEFSCHLLLECLVFLPQRLCHRS